MKHDDDDLPVYDEEFPTDDEYSLQEIGGGFIPLNILYGSMYVDKEEIKGEKNGSTGAYNYYRFSHENIVDRTVTGEIYYDNKKVQSFVSLPSPKEFGFTSYPHDGPKVIEVKMHYKKGILELTWDKKIKADKTKVVVCYEYERES